LSGEWYYDVVDDVCMWVIGIIAGGYVSDGQSAEEVAHVHFLLFFLGRRGRGSLLLIFLLVNLFLSDGGSGSGGSRSSGAGSRSSEVKKGTDIFSLEGLGEEFGPVGFDFHTGGSDELADLVT
jgi:hypothetical protein